MSAKVILVWFRNDLRTSDNEVLLSAVEKSDFIIPVYIFDPRYYDKNKFNIEKTGSFRKDYITKSVISLKNKLQELGGDLLTFEGYPEDIIPQLVQKYDADEVYHHREVAKRETSISELVEEALWKIKRNLKHFIGHTLYHKEDLPFPIRDIPNDFNVFKKKIIKESFVRPLAKSITSIKVPPHLEKTMLKVESDTDVSSYGESAALNILNSITSDSINEADAYTLLSPFLALGVISAAQTYFVLTNNINSKNKKVINVVIENLFLRDYFRFMLKKHPNYYFINNKVQEIDQEKLTNWISGNTDNNQVNSLIRKLNETGNINKIEREIVALYFVYELQQNWLYGAAWFEQQLVDYAPATNYGFWAHIAGQGTSLKNNKSKDDLLKYKQFFDKQLAK